MSRIDAPLSANIAARLPVADRRSFAQACAGLRREAPSWPPPKQGKLRIRELASDAQATSLNEQLQAYVPPSTRLDIVVDKARHTHGYAELCLNLTTRLEAGAPVRLSTMEYGACTPDDYASAMLSRYFLGL